MTPSSTMPDAPKSEYLLVTPAMAAAWLENNSVNRRVRPKAIVKYISDLRAGRWVPNNDAICLNLAGELLNGQHRCLAVVESGVSAWMLVVRGLPTDTIRTMDSGVPRSVGDILRFDGEVNAHLLGATAKLAMLAVEKRLDRDPAAVAVSAGQLREFIDKNPELRESVALAAVVKGNIEASPSAIATAHWLIERVAGPPYPALYFAKLASRVDLAEGSAVLAVDRRLREIRRNREVTAARNYLYLLIKGWNYWAIGRSVRMLTTNSRGSLLIPEPVKYAC